MRGGKEKVKVVRWTFVELHVSLDYVPQKLRRCVFGKQGMSYMVVQAVHAYWLVLKHHQIDLSGNRSGHISRLTLGFSDRHSQLGS